MKKFQYIILHCPSKSKGHNIDLSRLLEQGHVDDLSRVLEAVLLTSSSSVTLHELQKLSPTVVLVTVLLTELVTVMFTGTK